MNGAGIWLRQHKIWKSPLVLGQMLLNNGARSRIWLHSGSFLFQTQDSKSEGKLAFYGNDKIIELRDGWEYFLSSFHNTTSPGKQGLQSPWAKL